MGCAMSTSQQLAAGAPRRALSLPNPLIHHPSLRKGDPHHLVSLTSTTYGYASLLLEPSPADRSMSPERAPTVINAWELMHGLDDDEEEDGFCLFSSSSSSFQQLHPTSPPKPSEDSAAAAEAKPTRKQPLWRHLSEETLLAEMDPVVASALRRQGMSEESKGGQCRRCDDRVVVYFTSLRGIRRTYEDCCTVRSIFRSLRVAVDERDVSMDSAYKAELRDLMAGKEAAGLPQVFVKGEHLGGAEEVRQLHESGRLGELLRGVPTWDPAFVCGGCGDTRFIPCGGCSGSRKVFVEEEGLMRRCGDCNENGLIRCPKCCYS